MSFGKNNTEHLSIAESFVLCDFVLPSIPILRLVHLDDVCLSESLGINPQSSHHLMPHKTIKQFPKLMFARLGFGRGE
jgi:hypothetical protein